jgi:hypothetical protein
MQTLEMQVSFEAAAKGLVVDVGENRGQRKAVKIRE